MNEELERRVIERTRELTYKNQALQLAQKILDQVSLGILGVGDDGIIVQANQMACTLLQTSARDILGRCVEEVLPDWLARQVMALAGQVAAGADDPDPMAHLVQLTQKGVLCAPQTDGAQVYGVIIQFLHMSEPV